MERIQQITHPDRRAFDAAQEIWDSIAKPLGSFGTLETMIAQIAAIQGTPEPVIDRRTAVIFCADHGIVEEGVTQCGSDVTAVCAAEIAAGRSNVNAVAASCHADTQVIDIGIQQPIRAPHLINRKIAAGTANFTKSPAMTAEQVQQAVCVGMDTVRDLKSRGTQIILSGEMGIGNTTSAAAIASVLLNLPPETVTGRGSGLSTAGLQRKIETVRRGIALHRPSAEHPLHLLQTLGGLEIAGMTGLFLGGAYYRIPVVIDGVISAAAAAIAYKMQPVCGEYMLASHCSEEPAAEGLLRLIGQKPVIRAGLRLGEGTGALLLLPLLDGALALCRNAHRFTDANIERYTKQL